MTSQPVPKELKMTDLQFSVAHQRVDLELDLLHRSLRGRTTLTVIPLAAGFDKIWLNCRQCRITHVSIDRKTPKYIRYNESTRNPNPFSFTTIKQYHQVERRLEKSMRDWPVEELEIGLPNSVKIEALDPFNEASQSLLASKAGKRASDIGSKESDAAPRTAIEQDINFKPISLIIDFETQHIRDGLHFVGLDEGDLRYPHISTLNLTSGQAACSLFPCIDRVTARSTWEIAIKTPRTIGDIWRHKRPEGAGRNGISNGITHASIDGKNDGDGSYDEDMAAELTVLCSGDLINETNVKDEPSMKVTEFSISKEISVQHVGFVIGVFEEVDLSRARGGDEDDLLGQNAVPLLAYCSPGRSELVKNTCFPLAQVMEHNAIHFGSFPYSIYRLCFVDDLPDDIHHAATLSICSNRLLFPADILDPIYTVTRKLVHALNFQLLGIDVVPKEPEDAWAVIGMAYFMTDIFMRKLCGINEYRYQKKLAADKVVELDTERPSLRGLGLILHLDPSQLEFMILKAPLVLFILEQRILKGGSSNGVSRIITRVLLNAKLGEITDGAMDTTYFIKLCERLSHAKLDNFFKQWVDEAGCPKFKVTQRFNKKKLVVEMHIQQVQNEVVKSKALEPATFIRDIREDQREIYAGAVQDIFTGPMTIRIHEADGTPYEHIVEIKSASQKFDIPYNTKYKRIKRNRRQKERAIKSGDAEYVADDSGDVVLYSLGDILQSDDDIADWRMEDWPKEEEENMSQESYEWIRMDADFEWICRIQLFMPGYMFVSQLQQDRDVVAQHESMQHLAQQSGHGLICTFLTRTLMDSRYFHGIRTAAAHALAKNSKQDFQWVGFYQLKKAFQTLFCYPNSTMTRPNNFNDRATYLLLCAITAGTGDIRDKKGRSPLDARRWLLEKLKYNDNSDNDFSDAYYVAGLLQALGRGMATIPPLHELNESDETQESLHFQNECLEVIDRYRRVDEWIPSHHNVVSRAALDCKRMLVQARIVKYNPLDFLQYTSDATSSTLRLQAFTHLIEMSLLTNEALFKVFMFTLGHDASPWMRDQLLHLLGRVLGRIAIGNDMGAQTEKSQVVENELVVEKEATTEGHKAATEAEQTLYARKHTVEGALAALKTELGSNQVLAESIWDAVNSPIIGLRQLWSLLEICDKICDYDPDYDFQAWYTFKQRQYYSLSREGRTKFVFRPTGRYRDPVARIERMKSNLKPIKLKMPLSDIPATAKPVKSPASKGGKASFTRPEPVRRTSSTGEKKAGSKPKSPFQRQTSVTSLGSVEDAHASPGARPNLGPKKLTLKFKGLGSSSPT